MPPKSPEQSLADAAKRIAQLEAQVKAQEEENRKLAAAKQQTMSMAVSAKGAVSVYGLGRFPVTLYPAQWERLATKVQDVLAFITEGRKLGAFGQEDKAVAFVQPNNLPLKFKAKPASDKQPKAGSAL